MPKQRGRLRKLSGSPCGIQRSRVASPSPPVQGTRRSARIARVQVSPPRPRRDQSCLDSTSFVVEDSDSDSAASDATTVTVREEDTLPGWLHYLARDCVADTVTNSGVQRAENFVRDQLEPMMQTCNARVWHLAIGGEAKFRNGPCSQGLCVACNTPRYLTRVMEVAGHCSRLGADCCARLELAREMVAYTGKMLARCGRDLSYEDFGNEWYDMMNRRDELLRVVDM